MKKLLLKSVYLLGVFCMAVLLPFGLTACSSDDKPIMDQEPVAVVKGGDVVKGINVTMADFIPADAQTRTAYSSAGGGLSVSWASGDTIGIFPNEGAQVEFPIEDITDSHEATFDGGGWALRASSSYAAYYPFSKENYYRDNQTIWLDYTGQTQTANGSISHLAQYDFQATNLTKTNSSGFLNFQFKHLGALLLFRLTVPKPGVYTSLTLSVPSCDFVKYACLDVSGSEYKITPRETSESVTLNLDNIQLTSANSVLTAYMLIHGCNLSNYTITLTLNGSSNYFLKMQGQNLSPGYQYPIEKTFSEEYIPFANEITKNICIQNWDTNGDEELNFEEAAAVTDIGLNLSSSQIESFDEFRYFTGVQTVGNLAFYNCNYITSIQIPESVTSIGNNAFSNCKKLTTINIPDGVTSLGYYVFAGCNSLTSIDIPDAVTVIDERCFWNCNSLTSIGMPKNLKTIGNISFYNCNSLTSIEIPDGVTSIGNRAFQNCSNLTSIVLPKNLETIGDYAFVDCLKLTSFTCLATTPPEIGAHIYNNVNGIIYVPAASVDTYKNANGWKQFADQIQAIP